MHKGPRRTRARQDTELRRINQYKDFHSFDGITSLSLESFKEKIFNLWAFSSWGNKDWFLENTMKVTSKSFPDVKKNIAELCFGKDEIEVRINNFVEATDGMKYPFISEILYLATDSKYPIYNAKAKTVLEQLGINVKDNLPRGSKRNRGLIYKEFVSTYQQILDYVNSKNKKIDTFEKLDTLFWLVNYSEDASPIPLSTVQNKSTDDFTILVVKMGSKQKDFHKLKKFWKDESIASFGFSHDLDGYDPQKHNEYNYEYLKSVMSKNGAPEGRIKKVASYIQSFHNVQTKKDWVIAYYKSHLYGFGRVTSGYHINNNLGNDWNQSIGVEWTWLENPIRLPEYSRPLYRQARHNSSVNVIDNSTAIKDFLQLLDEYGKEEQVKNVEEEVENQVGSLSLEQVAENTFLTEERLSHIESSLTDSKKKQIIFDGVPGTGKTFVAQELAKYLANKEGNSIGDIETVSCHGGMTFEYLFQGLAPNKEGGLKPEKGIVTRLAERASENEDAYYVLILDEINRTNIPQVFGQMLYLLEYRGKDIELPYDGETINLPENLLIITTMNSEDRSAGVLDFAFRRRFSHFRFDPDNNVLSLWLNRHYKNTTEVDIKSVVSIFKKLNAKLLEFDENFQVGHSYFMTSYPLTSVGLKRLWETEINPLLEERFFHNKSVVKSEFSLSKFLDNETHNEEKLAG